MTENFSNISNDAKWITIPMETWERKYKPMEMENNDLKSRLANNKIHIRVQAEHTYMGSHPRLIGVVYLTVDKGWNVEINDWRALKEQIQAAYQKSDSYAKVLTEEEAREIIRELRAQYERTTKKMEDYRSYVKSLPRIIRWILKIKL